MTPRVLVAYATTNGSTREIAESIGATLRDHGLRAEVQAASDADDPQPFDGVVIGGAIYMGRWHRDARRFLRRHRRVLSTMPVAMFGIGPTTIDDKSVASSLGQLERALARVPEVPPVSVAIFGGVIDPARLHFPFSGMAASDARDWDDITAWAGEVAGHVPHVTIPM
jgi:menaquinone-dependent protoporphyrinogen oxidase